MKRARGVSCAAMSSALDSRIESVTVYHQGATVCRRVEVPCTDGKPPAEISVAGLPLSLLDGTVRVRVLGGGVVATQVRVGLHVARNDNPPAAPDIEERRRLVQAMALNQDARDQLDTELAMLRSVPVPERPEAEEGKAPPPSPMAARLQLEEVTEAAVAARVSRLRELRLEHEALRDQIHEMEQRLALASTARAVRPDELRKAVTVALLREDGAACPDPLPLLLEYHVPGARWAPSYQCRMARDCREAEIALRALVAQRSGEDWRGVTLRLSTAAPMRWSSLPELASVRIGKAQPPSPRRAGFRPPPVGAALLFGDHDRDLEAAAGMVPPPAHYATPSLAVPPPPRLQRSPPQPRQAARRDEPAPDVADKTARYHAVAAEAPPPAPAPPPAFGPPPMPARAPAPAAAMPAKRKRGRAEAAFDDDEERAAPVEVRAVLTELSLPAPSDKQRRSRLQAAGPREAYAESLARLDVTVPFDAMAAVAEAARSAAAVASLPAPHGTSDVRSAAGAFDYAYVADVAVDVPSDGQFHSVPVSTRTAASEVLYVVVPREDTSVYRQAHVHNPLAAPLLPGPVEVYVGGDYVLGSALPMVAPKGDFELGLGVEQAIKCARNTRFREERSGTKVVATNELWHEIAVELVNHLGREVDVEVRERIPQPAPEAEVVVEEGKVEPPWEAYLQTERSPQRLEGGRRWRLSVAAGASATLRADYVVKIYAQNEIAGGNRREA
jgi:hypothetical protein